MNPIDLFYNHRRLPKKSTIEHALDTAHREEQRLRRFCMKIGPATKFGLCEDHPLREVLPDAVELKPAAIKKLNMTLPGVIYQTPVIRRHLIDLSKVAFRSNNKGGAAQRARTLLKSLACPIDEDRDSIPLTRHLVQVVDLVAFDFYMVRHLFKSHRAAVQHDLVAAVKSCFRDIPEGWINRLYESSKITVLAAERLGELTGYNGRGIYKLWRREFGRDPEHLQTIRQHAEDEAEKIDLFR